MNRIKSEYVEQLEAARRRKGMSVEQLALLSGYPADLLRPLLVGESPDGGVSEHMKVELCQVLNLDAGETWRLMGVETET